MRPRPQEVLEADQLSRPRGEPVPNGAAVGGHQPRPQAEGLPTVLLVAGMTSPSPKADLSLIAVIISSSSSNSICSPVSSSRTKGQDPFDPAVFIPRSKAERGSWEGTPWPWAHLLYIAFVSHVMFITWNVEAGVSAFIEGSER